ncbi:MAG: hypothetical protein AAGJ18_16600 [Bacteroidota bacterium]
MLAPEITDKVKNLIAKNELAKALKILLEANQNNEGLDQLILQSGQLAALQKDQQKGIIDYGEQQKYLNQFRANLLDFVNKSPAISPNANTVNSKKLKGDYQKAKARVAVLQVLTGLEEGQTITYIYQAAKIKQRKLVVSCLNELQEVGYVDKEKVSGTIYWKLNKAGEVFAEELIL